MTLDKNTMSDIKTLGLTLKLIDGQKTSSTLVLTLKTLDNETLGLT